MAKESRALDSLCASLTVSMIRARLGSRRTLNCCLSAIEQAVKRFILGKAK